MVMPGMFAIDWAAAGASEIHVHLLPENAAAADAAARDLAAALDSFAQAA